MSEYDAMMGRCGRPYSDGHRAMYDAPIAIIRNTQASILDVGCGIGYGAERMVSAQCIKRYIGIDPDPKCISWCERNCDHPDMSFRRCDMAEFDECNPDITFDYVFCIEVFEHVDEGNYDFIKRLRDHTGKNLFLSTPNKHTSAHGVISPQEMTLLMSMCGFDVVYVEQQWTTLFVGGV